MPVINGTSGNDGITGSPGDDTINGFAGDDVINGDPNVAFANGNDSINGGDGDDLLRGRVGDDTMNGGTGDDLLDGGLGNDSLDGGGGLDRVTFASANTGVGVHVDLTLQGTVQDTGQGNDVLVNFVHLSGTAFADTLVGDGQDNWIWGEGGNDNLSGGAGNDLVEIGGGPNPSSDADTVTADGGAGVDTLSFDQNGSGANGAHFSLALQGSAQATGLGVVTATGFENVTGSGLDDTLAGDGNANILLGFAGSDSLAGGAGNDTLYGDGAIVVDSHGVGTSGPIVLDPDAATTDHLPGGNDTLDGGDGDDTVIAGGGDDVLIGGSGNNSLDGNDGFDTADYSGAAGPLFLITSGATYQVDHTDGVDTLTNVERVLGSTFDDQMLGGAGNDDFEGGDGHDFLRGGAGDDTLSGGTGDDFLNGQAGNDLLDGGDGVDRAAFFTGATAGVHVDLNIQGSAQDTGQGLDTLISIENVSGTSFADTLIGDGGDNWVWGEDGNDSLEGGGGNDLVQIGGGAVPSTDADQVTADGGSGVDTASFDQNGGETTGVDVSLALQGTAQATGLGTITLTGFENLSGSRADDTLAGDANGNLLAGFLGSDSLSGGGGDDTLYGDGDVIDDTHGTGFSGPIALDPDGSLTNAVPGGNDTLDGGDGNDTEFGGQGDDVLIGGSGNNLLDGNDGFDTASYANSTGPISLFHTPSGYEVDRADGGTDTLTDVEKVVGSGFDDQMVGGAGNDDFDGGAGQDLLRGGAGDDTLVGGAGDDFLVGQAGNDVLDGGDGFDRAGFFNGATAGVHVDLNIQGTAQDTGQGLDTLINIEHVSGTQFADTLVGNAGDNWIWGQGGNDSLEGGAGNDLVQVGGAVPASTDADQVTADGGAGVDTISFDQNGDDTTGVTVSLALQGAAQATGVSTVTLTGFENVSGSALGDTITGDGGDNVLAGAAGDDLITAGGGGDLLLGDGAIVIDTHGAGTSGPIVTLDDASAFAGTAPGNDTLVGGSGADTLIGGGGADVLTGGKGDDHFVFLSTSDSAPGASDLITDLDKKDVIDLSAIDANVNLAGDQAFVLVHAFDGHAGEAVLAFDPHAHMTTLSLDVNGDGVADFVLDIAGNAKTFDNFIL